MPETIRVVVVDDHTLVAQSIVGVLGMEDDITVVAVAATAAAALDEVRRHRPDVLVLDHSLPDGGGAPLVAVLKAAVPETEIVMITGGTDDNALLASVQAGALAFITKDRALEELVLAVRAAKRHEPALSPAVVRRLLVAREAAAASTLTARETDVLTLLAAGRSNEAIAEELFVSAKTVRNHIQNIIRKLDAHSKLEAVVKGVQAGLVRIMEEA